MKKIIAIILAVFSLGAGIVAFAPTQEVSATGADCSNHFLGLKAWYDGVTDDKCNVQSPGTGKSGDDQKVKQFVWTIVLNVVSMILGIVGYVAIGFVMWGGIQYMTGQGDPGKVARGKRTITNAVIGIIIVASASIISGALSGIISGAAGKDGDFFKEIFNSVFLWSGIVAVIMMVWGGIQYATSAGDPAKAAKGKQTIMYAAIGLLIVITAAAIVSTVIGATGTQQNSSGNNPVTPSSPEPQNPNKGDS